MRSLCFLLAACLAMPFPPAISAQEPAHKLSLVIVEGEGAINNIRQRTAREPIVQVDDENHRPVAGAAVLFLLPSRGAGGTFADGSHSLTVITDSQGRAAVHGFTPNNVKGQFQIQVTASLSGAAPATGVITQSNAVAGAAGGSTAAAAGMSTKLIVILAVVGAAAAGAVAYAVTHSGGGNAGTTPGTTITAGAGTVGPPN
jgi:hypothetical protein